MQANKTPIPVSMLRDPDTLQAPQSHTVTVPLDLQTDLDTLLSPSSRLIDAPDRIPASHLDPFQHGTQDLLLVFAAEKTACPAVLRSVHYTSLIATSRHPVTHAERGALVLVVFRVSAQLHYVLQTSIETWSTFQLKLVYGDSRRELRRRIQCAGQVTLHVLPPTLVTALRHQDMQAVRNICLPTLDTVPPPLPCITERLWAADTELAAPPWHDGQATPGLAGTLGDISLGGLCLAPTTEFQSEALLHQLVYLDIPFPPAPAALPQWDGIPLTLQLFGVVRGIHPLRRTLHIRFVKRLPPVLDAYFAALESLPDPPGESR